MKPKKRRVNLRLKESLYKKVESLSISEERTCTDIIETALAYGLKWYEAKIKREIQTSSNSETPRGQDNNKPTQPAIEEEEPTPSNEEIKKQIEDLYKKHQKTK